ncbi:small G protein signaling modulator 1-like isoform X3 [Clavelina lepadiformis]|uniref:small G protein signaling modulator 1-like isoform X3 n=1 Tax=Clavelina lepadiformis TaxID=159417 RepID=UPI0040423413
MSTQYCQLLPQIRSKEHIDVENQGDTQLNLLKAQVKALMEESVTKKFVHEESGHVLKLCGTIENCLLGGLKKHRAGFFHFNKIANLFAQVAKRQPDVHDLISKIEEVENILRKQRTFFSTSDELCLVEQKSFENGNHRKYLWVRMALTSKLLTQIVEDLVKNSSKYYEKTSIMSDPVRGKLIASLLVGPCALDYTKMKTQDHYWSDPPAVELLQRHKLHNRCVMARSSGRRPALNFSTASNHSTKDSKDKDSVHEYVESLHQNSKMTLLYGKNNVLVQPRKAFDAIPGYLSLHQETSKVIIKWTPNQLINISDSKSDSRFVEFREQDSSVYWDLAISLDLGKVVYLHCHQQNDKSGTLVFVGQDGVQWPPIHFPPGGHLLSFLSCLEVGLVPHGNLDPPLGIQKGQEKNFPHLRRRCHNKMSHFLNNSEEEMEFVFRLNSSSKSGSIVHPSERFMSHLGMYTGNENSSHHQNALNEINDHSSSCHTSPLKVLCKTMQKQIIARTFYGWLAYCRHLMNVRTHLSDLVNETVVHDYTPFDASYGINRKIWEQLFVDGKLSSIEELSRYVYFGGVEPSLRPIVWLYLLGHYSAASSPEEQQTTDAVALTNYQDIMMQWLEVKKIIVQREQQTQSSVIEPSNQTSNLYCNFPASDYSRAHHPFHSLTSPSYPSAEFSTKTMSLVKKKCELIVAMEEHEISDTGDVTNAEKFSFVSSKTDVSTDPVEKNFPIEFLEQFALNLHRIEKDVHRCDRNHSYFSESRNLDKLRNVICSYVWCHMEVGYLQGMCDIAAPLLVVLDNESLVYSSFVLLMKRLGDNFPNFGAMDLRFANMRLLTQILDEELYEHMHKDKDYTHFYFCYRWFLLDFKRELSYNDDVFAVWECIWAARYCSSKHFVLFFALAMLQSYREIILENDMDPTDIIKFFNEMAEKHNAKEILKSARNLVAKVQLMILK